MLGFGLGMPGRDTNHVLVPGAAVLFVPAGVILLFIARRAAGEDAEVRRGSLAWLGLVALAFIGVGIHAVAPGPWTLLALPSLGLALYGLLRALVRGRRDPFYSRLVAARRGGAFGAGLKARAICVICLPMVIYLGALAVAAAA